MNQERIFTVLKGPHVSEKATVAADQANQYVFRVSTDATRAEIKAAIEQLFKVSVVGVQVANVKGKVKANRYGATRRPGWKKAYVRVASGQEIDFSVVA